VDQIAFRSNGTSNVNLPQARKKTDKLLADWRHAKRCVREEKERLAEAEQSVADALEAQQVLQGIAETVQNQAHSRIASVVTRCLQAVFGDEMSFRIAFKQARGKTEAQLLIVKDDEELDPLDSCGGGVISVAAFALRVACLMLSRPQKRRLLVLDEAFSMVSKDYLLAVRDILMTLAKEMGIQIILVTHLPLLQIDEVIEL